MIKAMLLARALGPGGFGAFALVTALVATVAQLFDLNLGQSVIKFGNDYSANGDRPRFLALLRAGWLSAFGGAAAFLIVGGGSLALWHWLSSESLSSGPITMGLALLCFAAAMDLAVGFSASLLKLKFRFRQSALIDTSSTLIELLIIASILLVGIRQLQPYLVCVAAASCIKSSLTLLVMRASLGELMFPSRQSSLSALRPHARALVEFTLSNSLSRTLKHAYSTGDVLLLAAVASSTDVGMFNAAKKLGLSVVLLTQPLLATIYAQLAQLVSQNRFGAVRSVVCKVTGIGSALALPALLVILWLRREITQLAFGAAFGAAAAPLVFLAALGCVRSIFFWTNSQLLALGMAKERLLLDLLALGLSAGLGAIGGSFWGAAGFAGGLLAAQALREAAAIVTAFRAIGLRRKEIAMSDATGPQMLSR